MKLFNFKKVLGLPHVEPASMTDADSEVPTPPSLITPPSLVVANQNVASGGGDTVHTFEVGGLQYTTPAGWSVQDYLEGMLQMATRPNGSALFALYGTATELEEGGDADDRKLHKKYEAGEAEEEVLNGMEHVYQPATGISREKGAQPRLLKRGYIGARQCVSYSFNVPAGEAEIIDKILNSIKLIPLPPGSESHNARPPAAPAGALPPGWKTVQHENFGVSIAMPGEPSVKDTTYTTSSDGVEYSIYFLRKQDWNGAERQEAQAEFNRQATSYVVVGRVYNRRYAPFQGRPGCKFTVQTWIGGLLLRIQMVATAAGVVIVTANAGTETQLLSPEVEAFFHSLQLTGAN